MLVVVKYGLQGAQVGLRWPINRGSRNHFGVGWGGGEGDTYDVV